MEPRRLEFQITDDEMRRIGNGYAHLRDAITRQLFGLLQPAERLEAHWVKGGTPRSMVIDEDGRSLQTVCGGYTSNRTCSGLHFLAVPASVVPPRRRTYADLFEG